LKGNDGMAEWTTEQAARIAAPQEVEVMTQRRDGSPRRPVTIWIVGDGDRDGPREATLQVRPA